MTLLYMIVERDKTIDSDFYVYLRTLDGKKAQRLKEILDNDIPGIEMLTFEIDQPVYSVDLKYKDRKTTVNTISVGEPEHNTELKEMNVTITRKRRLI